MKVNLRKVGAIVAGATILASSAAFAGLMFGSTTLVDDNGAPVAKVVVGSKAMPSDGVAAALIAGKIVSETYKSSTLTAQVSGTAACAAGNGTADRWERVQGAARASGGGREPGAGDPGGKIVDLHALRACKSTILPYSRQGVRN